MENQISLFHFLFTLALAPLAIASEQTYSPESDSDLLGESLRAWIGCVNENALRLEASEEEIGHILETSEFACRDREDVFVIVLATHYELEGEEMSNRKFRAVVARIRQNMQQHVRLEVIEQRASRASSTEH